MKRWLIIAGLVVLTAALVFLNQGMKKTAQPDHDDDDQPKQSQSQSPATLPAPGGMNAVLPPEETVGNPTTAKHHISVGWVYDENNQQKPQTLTVPIQAVRDFATHMGPSVSAEIVNLDVPLEDRSLAARTVTNLGLTLDQKTLYGGNLSDSPMSEEAIMQNLSKAISH